MVRHMRVELCGLMSFAFVLAAAGRPVAADTYIYTTLNNKTDPHALAGTTAPAGISGSSVVGSYQVYYVQIPTGPIHYTAGFLYNDSTYTTLIPPGAFDAYPQGVSGSNVVGIAYNYNDDSYGFLYNGSTYITFKDPIANSGTLALGVSGGNVVGYYTDASGGDHGFLYNGSTYTTLDDPAVAAGHTLALGISGDDVVGYYTDASGNQHGYLYDGSTYTTIDQPGAGGTEVVGISGNTLVVQSTLGGFVATPTAVPEPAVAAVLAAVGFARLTVRHRRRATVGAIALESVGPSGPG